MLGFFLFSTVSYLYLPTQQSTFAGVPKQIEFEFLYTSEKQGWVEEVTPQFEKWFSNKFNIKVKVRLTVMGTHQTINEILHGAQPTAWSPASSLWIPYLNKMWKKQGHGSDIATKWVPLVVTPTVIACWGSFQKKYNVTGFKKLFQLVNEGVNFKYGHTDPLLSNSGVTAVIHEFSSALNKTPDKIKVSDLTLKAIIDGVKALESKSVYYGSSTGFFGKWAAESGPSSINVFVVYENVVLENSLKAYKMYHDKLVAVYPEEGLILNDHPFVILNASWVNIWQRFAATQYLLYLLSYDVQEKAQKHGFRPVNPSVPLNKEIFNEKNGVQYRLPSKALNPPSGEVLDSIFTVWAKVRNPGVQG